MCMVDPSWRPLAGGAAAAFVVQQTVRKALATCTHHSAPRRQTKAREWHRHEYDALRRQKPPPPQQVLFQSLEEEPGGGRPAPLPEVAGWQARVQRHAVEHLADLAPLVQIIDALVPQMVDQLLDIVQFFRALSPVPEQVVEVPKLLPYDVPTRAAVRDTQLAEQLVEVPTIKSFFSLQRSVEQHVDIPVPGRGWRNVGLQGFPREQSSTVTASSQERLSERIVEQIIDFSVCGGGLQDFRPGQSSPSSSHFPAFVHEVLDEPGQGFFSHFSPRKKCACRRKSKCEGAPARQLTDSGG